MRNLLYKVFDMFGRVFSRDEDRLTRSKLVGMYLNRTNHNNSLSVEMQRTRQRRNGKFSSKRERH
ncbi:MAG: hypothetical protein ACFHW5_16965 [Verrucomicrobiota bacterium]